jgi:hypothetical protein
MAWIFAISAFCLKLLVGTENTSHARCKVPFLLSRHRHVTYHMAYRMDTASSSNGSYGMANGKLPSHISLVCTAAEAAKFPKRQLPIVSLRVHGLYLPLMQLNALGRELRLLTY